MSGANKSGEVFIETMAVAKRGSALLPKGEQLRNISAAVTATEAFINGKATREQFGTVLNMYNMINALVSVPGALKGHANDFCIEVCETIKQIAKRQSISGVKPLTVTEAEQLNAMKTLYVDIISNVTQRILDKAEDILNNRLEQKDGVSDLDKPQEENQAA